MRLLIPAILAMLSVSCSKQEPPGPAAAAAPLAQRQDSPREVTLDRMMQQQGGVAVEQVAVRSIPQVIRATGRITVNELHTWRVGSVTEGRIVRILASPGDAVGPGEVLARMHSHDIHEARALYRRAVSDLTRSKELEAFAQRTRDRLRRLYELKAASLEQVDHAETELRSAQAVTHQAEVEVARTRQHLVDYLQIPVEEPAPHKEGEAEPDEDLVPIKSPAAGIVLTRTITPGTVVSSSQDLFVVSDLSDLWMIAAVNEEFLPNLRAGMPARVAVQAYPNRSFAGKVTKIGEELDQTTRTIRARIEIPNRTGLLKPEMYAVTEIETGGSSPALFIPESAPQEVSGQTAVFVRKAQDRFEVRLVALGRTLEGQIEVVSGLRTGETVVTKGSFLLKSQLLKATLGE